VRHDAQYILLMAFEKRFRFLARDIEFDGWPLDTPGPIGIVAKNIGHWFSIGESFQQCAEISG
jgi:hypothetical protein